MNSRMMQKSIVKNTVKWLCFWGVWIALLGGLAGCTLSEKLPETIESLNLENQDRGEPSELKAEEYQGQPYVEINNNEPDFTEEDVTTEEFEEYSSLDNLGRCGEAYANICQEIMPKEKRGTIGMVKPSGWHTVKYQVVDGKYLYNRCHLIGYQLAGENANEKNLITGTRYLNVEGMLPFENQVADYVKETGNHVLYRVTPVYDGENLVAEGVRMEGYSVEDKGEGVSFHVFVYNVQPGVEIDYSTGDSSLSEEGDSSDGKGSEKGKKSDTGEKKDLAEGKDADTGDKVEEASGKQKEQYVINKNTRKFHLPDCSSVEKTLPKNRKAYTGSREKLISQGYQPCDRCKP